MGGVGNHRSAPWSRACCSALSRPLVARLFDPGLTLAVDLCAVPRRAADAADRPVREAGALNRRYLLERRRLRSSWLRICAAVAAGRQRLSPRARHQHPELRGAGDRLGAVLGPDPLHLARHRRVLRHRRLHGRPCWARVLPWPLVLLDRGRGRRSWWRWWSGFPRCACPASISSSSPSASPSSIRQLVTWYEVNIHARGRPLRLRRYHRRPRSTGSSWRSPCWRLLTGFLIRRSRLGLALRVIGDDETVARHCRHRHHARQARAVRPQRRCS